MMHQLSSKPDDTVSLWIDTTPDADYPTLEKDITVDVAILGAGIAGITTAVRLKEAGLKVVLIESRKVVEGATGYTTAKVTSAHTLIYDHLISNFGQELAQQYADANQAAIEWVAKQVEQKKIEADFSRQTMYVYASDNKQRQQIEQEYKAAQSLKLPVNLVDEVPLPIATKGAICYNNQAQFHPRKYLLALLATIPGNGSHVFQQTRALDVKEGEPCHVITNKGTVTAKQVVVATHYPIYDPAFYFTRLYPFRDYAVAFTAKQPLSDDMFIGAGEPAYSLRSQPSPDGTLYILGGRSHPAGRMKNAEAYYQELIDYATKELGAEKIVYHWSTQDNSTPDKIPYIGLISPFSVHVYVATGFGGWGMTNGTVAGLLISDFITEKSNPWAEVYNPNRFKPLVSAQEFTSQNIEVAEHFISGKLSKGCCMAANKLQNGQAEILDDNGEKVAVYKDEAGKIHALSAYCTHMGCVVNWNNSERSWDCPCHGSRFDYSGQVLHGPAVKDLAKKEVGTEQ